MLHETDVHRRWGGSVQSHLQKFFLDRFFVRACVIVARAFVCVGEDVVRALDEGELLRVSSLVGVLLLVGGEARKAEREKCVRRDSSSFSCKAFQYMIKK